MTAPTPTTDAAGLDPQFKYDVAAHPGGENITLCYACGTCTASCPVSAIDSEFNPRRIIRRVLLGRRAEVLADPTLWRCVQCYACYSQCPQNVKFRDVMRALRELAVAEGIVPQERLDQVRQLDTFAQRARRSLLDKLLDDPATARQTQAEIAKILGLDDNEATSP